MAYSAIARLTHQLHNTSDAHHHFREAPQLRVLLDTLRNSLADAESAPRLPASTTLFLAEAATIVTNSASPLFKTMNKFLLRAPTLPLRGFPLFHQMHDALMPEWRESRAWAAAAAAAAPAARALRAPLAAAAALAVAGSRALTADGAEAVRAYLSAAHVEASLPMSAQQLVASGGIALLANIAAYLLHNDHTSGVATVVADTRVQLALATLQRGAVVRHIWRSEAADSSASAFGTALKTLAAALAQQANTVAGHAADSRCRGVHEAFWRLTASVLRHAKAWQARRADALQLWSRFWLDACAVPRTQPRAGQLCALCDCILLTCPRHHASGDASVQLHSPTSSTHVVQFRAQHHLAACACWSGAGAHACNIEHNLVLERVLSFLAAMKLVQQGGKRQVDSVECAQTECSAPHPEALATCLFNVYAAHGGTMRQDCLRLLLYICSALAVRPQCRAQESKVPCQDDSIDVSFVASPEVWVQGSAFLSECAAGVTDLHVALEQAVNTDGQEKMGQGTLGGLLKRAVYHMRQFQGKDGKDVDTTLQLQLVCENAAQWVQGDCGKFGDGELHL